jgi:hypothetical protein
MKMKLTALWLVLIGALLLWSWIPAAASQASLQVQYATPTAQPDGRILYTVQAGDTCIKISLLTGISVDYLRTTNQLNEACDLREGQQLLIGVGGPAAVSPTPGASPTATPILPTATPGAGGTAQVCALMYVDLNGDGLRQETEFGLDGGAISLVSASGQYSQTLNTTSARDPLDDTEPMRLCFEDLVPGVYTISGGVPSGYNPTTTLNIGVDIVPGDTTYVDFGAQVQTASEDAGESGVSPLLGVLGGALLLVGIGMGVYAWRSLKKK